MAESSPSPAPDAALVSRRTVLSSMALAALARVVGAASPVKADEDFTSTSSGLKYKVVKEGGGARVTVGDLVAIRFRASYKGNTFDDLFATESPYFYRAGSSSVLKVSLSVPVSPLRVVHTLICDSPWYTSLLFVQSLPD
jgi:hypothetical protein